MATPRLLTLVLLGMLAACSSEAASKVTLYVALDQEHSERLIKRFEERTGIQVDARFDTESQKTVGFVNALIEEADRPRCDVFWNNEIANTAMLAQKGLFAPYDSPNANDLPTEFRDKDRLWTGFAARARILIVNKDRIKDPADYPKSMYDFLKPKWKGQCAIARPLTGTTLTHFVALHLSMGDTRFNEFLDGLFKNDVVFLQSNGATMRQTAAGKIAFALTDTDDFHVAYLKGHPVSAVFPDQGDDDLGTMLIPNSVALVKGGPNSEQAKKLIDFILSVEVESLLAAGKSAQIPLRHKVPGPNHPEIHKYKFFRMMKWDVRATGKQLADTLRILRKRFSKAQ